MDKMEKYINEISGVLEQNIRNREKLTEELIRLCGNLDEIESITIVASGSSYNAASCAIGFMRSLLDVSIELITPFDFLYYKGVNAKSRYLFVSQSGGSTNVLAAVRKARAEGVETTLITGNDNSAIAGEADNVILYGVGEETVGYVTKGVSTLILFFMLFALEYGRKHEPSKVDDKTYDAILEQMKIASANHHAVYETAKNFCEENRDKLLAMKNVFVVGCGSNMGTAAEAALKISEMVHVQTSVYEIEEFIHGPDLQLTPDYTLLFIDGGDEAGARVRQIQEAALGITDKSYLISAAGQAGVEEPFTPLCILAFFQYLAYWTMRELDIRDEHPLYEKFAETVSGKVEGYSEEEPF